MKINRFSLVKIRKLERYTTTAVAAACGVQQGHLSNVEAGRRPASDDLIYALAAYLEVHVQALVLEDLGIPEGIK